MMSITGKVSIGHNLFTQYATGRGCQKNNSARPSAECLDQIRKEMNRRCRDIPKYRYIKSIHGMWFWLDSTKSPVKPRLAYRKAIKRITKGEIPVDTWDLIWRKDD